MAWSRLDWMARRGFLRPVSHDHSGPGSEPVPPAFAARSGHVLSRGEMAEPLSVLNDERASDRLSEQPATQAHVVVIGNQKGGSGKSTTTMHLIAALMASGARVASIDLDARQGTLSQYIRNRESYRARRGVDLPMPIHRSIEPSSVASVDVARAHDAHAVEKAVLDLSPRYDYIVIDTPGTDNFLSRVGHSYADTLITPLNDSFVDLDVLASIDPETLEMTRPSQYADMVFQVKMQKARRDKSNRTFDWVVMRNRLGQLGSRNQWAMDEALTKLSARVGFRLVAGFSERVIFREMFLDGLTLLDLPLVGDDVKMSMSHVAARQEVRELMRSIGLDRLERVGQ